MFEVRGLERIILHSDLNCFYASVEMLYHPEYRDKPMAVSGDPDQRHGIILTANYLAKARGVRTGEAIWQARQKCPSLVTVPPDYSRYLRFSQMARKIYGDYTDQIEPFGIDEAWLDVTATPGVGDGKALADEIRGRIWRELGITASIGVSFNKVFAKIGSDYKKPDATTLITRGNYREIVWPLPVGDLLYVGPATRAKLEGKGIYTIGALAQTPPERLSSWLGKWGRMLWVFAGGLDHSPVTRMGEEAAIQSVGNSCTTPRDLESDEDVRMTLYILSDSVAARLREQGLRGRTVSLSIRDNMLASFTRQKKLPDPTCLTEEIAGEAFALFQKNYRWERGIRSIGVSVSDLSSRSEPLQLDLLGKQLRREEREALEDAMDHLRRRYGNQCVRRGVTLSDAQFAGMDPKREHVIHPVGFIPAGGKVGGGF